MSDISESGVRMNVYLASSYIVGVCCGGDLAKKSIEGVNKMCGSRYIVRVALITWAFVELLKDSCEELGFGPKDPIRMGAMTGPKHQFTRL
jgi:hypothetical protein